MYFRNFEHQTFGSLQHNLDIESEEEEKNHWVSSAIVLKTFCFLNA